MVLVELPDDVPFSLALGVVLAKSNLIAEGLAIDETVKPFPAQYAMGPGDVALVSGNNSMIDHDFTCVRLLEPEEHKDAFPDWETRLQNSYVLCRWNSAEEPDGDIGWFSRVKLIQISLEHYTQIIAWLSDKENGLPDHPPEWLQEYYNEYTDALARSSPGMMPTRVSCAKCGGRDVELHAIHSTRIAASAGEVVTNGKTTYVPLSPETECETEAHLHCRTCNARGDLSDDEWDTHQHH